MTFQGLDKRIALGLAALGLTSIITQTIVLREFLSVFAGNELVIGAVLANWMILTGAGAYLGRLIDRVRRKFLFLSMLLIAAALLPAMTVFLLRYLRNIVFPAGSMIGIAESLYSSFILLTPYCLVAGSLFVLLARGVSQDQESNSIAAAYSLESAGSVAGGLIFNLLILFFLSTFQALVLLVLLNLTVWLAISSRRGSRLVAYTAIALAVLVGGTIVAFNFDDVTRKFMFRDQSLLFQKDTPYGNLTVTRQGEQTNFFENSVLLFSADDMVANEEAVHYAMVQHPDPKSVLIVSGDMVGLTGEVLKYGVTHVDFAEMNPWLIGVQREYASKPIDRRVHPINEDVRRYLRHSEQMYDVALLNLPDPGTAQVNRYYTVEFFRELRSRLARNAVVSLSLLSSADYFGSEARIVSSSIYATLWSVFNHVLILPGNRNFLIASDGELRINVAQRIEQLGVPTMYVNRYYLDDELLRGRSDQIMKSLDTNAAINTDFTPIAYYRQVCYWLSYFAFSPWIPAAIVGLILVTVAFRLNRISFGMLTGGFAASSVEVLLLVSFQILYGYVYLATGVIITIFMGGLAIGAWYGRERSAWITVRAYALIQCSIALYCMVLPLVLSAMKGLDADGVIYGLFLLLTLIIAALVGVEFAVASRLMSGSISSVVSELYGIDLIGSAAGALLVSAYLLPLLGIGTACVLVGLFSLSSGFVAMVRWRTYPVKQIPEVANV